MVDSPNSLSPDDRRVRDAFRKAWADGERPSLDEHLTRCSRPDARNDLFRDLLEVELGHRAGRSESPCPEEYRRFVPEFSDVLRRLFDPTRGGTTGPPASDPVAAGRSVRPAQSEGETVAQLTPSPSALNPITCPVRVPGYEILDELGRGGMGVVYKALQTGLNRVVALKMVLSGDYASAAQLARFRLEAEAVAQLQHPHIVQVYGSGEVDGKPYLCLEFVDGGPLDKKLSGAPRPFREAAELVRLLAEAMHYAHERHILHRDIKPANILLTSKGDPKIADFGLAKKLDDQGGQTQSGSVMGTPNYMAPEQALGRTRELGPAADVYSLGAVLYEMLVGRPPFKGETVLDTLEQVRSREPVRPRRLEPKTPRDLETICLRCLRKDPKERYHNAQGLADDLKDFLAGRPIRARPHYWWRAAAHVGARSVWMWLLLLSLILAPVVWYVFWLNSEEVEGCVASSNMYRTRYPTPPPPIDFLAGSKEELGVGVSTVGLLSSPWGQGSLLAAAALVPGRTRARWPSPDYSNFVIKNSSVYFDLSHWQPLPPGRAPETAGRIVPTYFYCARLFWGRPRWRAGVQPRRRELSRLAVPVVDP